MLLLLETVLDDFQTSGPLSEASKTFVGGAEYFRATPTDDPTERKRGEGGNYFRDVYASGAILLPQLFDRYDIMYNTNDKTDDLANFIVDRPTILDVGEIGEPLVVIPTQRPIGQEIMNILFKEPFRKLETIFLDVVEKNNQKKNLKDQFKIATLLLIGHQFQNLPDQLQTILSLNEQNTNKV